MKLSSGLKKPALETLQVPDIVSDADGSTFVSNVRRVGSYDVLESGSTISPGRPRTYRPREMPLTLLPDGDDITRRTDIFEEQTAILDKFMCSGADSYWPLTDILADSGALRHLYTFVIGTNQGKDFCFRINVQIVGEGVLALEDVTTPANPRAYNRRMSHDVPVVAPGGRSDALAHYRILHFDFRGIGVLLRLSVEAEMPCVTETADNVSESSNLVTPTVDTVMFRAVPIKQQINWIQRGLIPPLLFGDIRRIAIGRHMNGVFSRIEVRAVDERSLLDGRPRAVDAMCKLRALLQILREKILAHGGRPGGKHFSLAVFKGGRVQLYENKNPLPRLSPEVKVRMVDLERKKRGMRESSTMNFKGSQAMAAEKGVCGL
ncbi:hypothetical protein PENSPDRAFT_750983 [Peniophora sp. CONT]|nr:hypothetical protein PENSPDRAFT_750983 [Peniophora sp. CONT]